MRTSGYSARNVVQLSRAAPSFERRPVASRAERLTCIVLVRHFETKLAIKVSDTGDSAKAIWIPKSMVIIEQPSNRGILVASMSQLFAEQKRLAPRFIDPTLFNEATREALVDAERRAARKRNYYRGHRTPNGRGSTQNAFC